MIPEEERRRYRQTIAILRDDWDAYVVEQRAMITDGDRRWHMWEILGLALWAGGRMEASLEAFRQGLVEHPAQRDLENREAEVLAVLGRTGEALALLDRLAAEEPHGKTVALRGWIRRESDPAVAAADYDAALALDPEQPVARVGRGLLRLAAGDLEGARADIAPFSHCGWSEAADALARLKAAEAGR